MTGADDEDGENQTNLDESTDEYEDRHEHGSPAREADRSDYPERGEGVENHSSAVSFNSDEMSIDEAGRLTEEAKKLFPGEEHPIFANKKLLQISHLPDSNRIVGREEQIEEVSSLLFNAVQGGDPENLLIDGRTGIGKSLVVKHVIRLLKWRTDNMDDGPSIGTAYIDCKEDNTETQTAISLGEILNERSESGIKIPETGLARTRYFKRLWRVIDELYDVVFIILDEIDKHQDDENLLATLSRAGEDQKIDAKIGIICITNKSQWVGRLETMSVSSFQQHRISFSAYDANDLRDIMMHRRDAFHDGVLTDDAIPLAAAFAAQEHGDARRALDILREAGIIAFQEDDTEVTEEHIRKANDAAEKSEIRELIGDEPTQSKLTLLALVVLSNRVRRDSDMFRTGEIYATYKVLAEEIDAQVLSERRVRGILSELSFFEITYTDESNEGRRGGRRVHHRSAYTADVVEEVLLEDSHLANAREPIRDGLLENLVRKFSD